MMKYRHIDITADIVKYDLEQYLNWAYKNGWKLISSFCVNDAPSYSFFYREKLHMIFEGEDVLEEPTYDMFVKSKEKDLEDFMKENK